MRDSADLDGVYRLRYCTQFVQVLLAAYEQARSIDTRRRDRNSISVSWPKIVWPLTFWSRNTIAEVRLCNLWFILLCRTVLLVSCPSNPKCWSLGCGDRWQRKRRDSRQVKRREGDDASDIGSPATRDAIKVRRFASAAAQWGREEIAKATVRYADFVSWESALQFSYGICSETEEFWADHNKSPSPGTCLPPNFWRHT